MKPAERRRLLLPIALGAVFVAQCCWFIGTQSLTYDEPVHILAGLDAWRRGRFEQWNDQPPLARLLVTLPLLSGSWRIEPKTPVNGAYWTISVSPDPQALAWRARLVNVGLGLVLAWLLWTTARRMFSEGGANLALGLFACSAPLIAHFSVATVDGSAALGLFATTAAVDRWRRSATWTAALVCGLVLGGFLLTKFSAPPLVALAIAIMITSPTTSALRERIARALCALAIAALVVWAAYFFHVGAVTFKSGSLGGPYAGAHEVIVPARTAFQTTAVLPAPEYVTAFGSVVQHGVRGQPAYLLGEVRRTGGWRSYFPIVAALKWPLIVWLVGVSALLALLSRRIPIPPGFGVTMMFPIVFFGLAIFSNIDVGDRYILPAYAFLLLLCAAAWAAMRTYAFGIVIAVCLVAVQAVDYGRYAPDALSYFNVFVPPDRSFGYLSDSNLDWGQGLMALRQYERAHPQQSPVRLAYFGGVDPADYGIHAVPLGERDRAAGTVVVSATHLSGQYLDDPSAYHWLLRYPHRILDHCLFVFDVSEEHR